MESGGAAAMGWDCDPLLAGLLWRRSCDVAAMPLRLLKHRSLRFGGNACIFRNVFDRVPGEHLDWTTSRTPHKDATLEQKQAANESIVKYIENDAEQIISEDARCYCHIHNLFCEAIPANVTSKRKREESTGSTDDEND